MPLRDAAGQDALNDASMKDMHDGVAALVLLSFSAGGSKSAVELFWPVMQYWYYWTGLRRCVHQVT